MSFDPTITFGAVLNAIVLLVGFVGAFVRIGGRIDLLALRMGAVEDALRAQQGLDKRLATIEERLTNHVQMLTVMQRELGDLRRGEGFITSRRRSIDGEYSEE